MANDYAINYDDKRFTEVEADKKAALSENEKLYSGMVNESDKYYQAQIDASKEWADKQTQLQQEKTDFAIDQIEQQKDQAKKDYTKEQSGAYVDWQKQSNQYGANAEQMAAGGLQNSGFSESSQVSMYNTYQNRVATARESYNNAILNYNNAIKDAQLQNNSALAEIAYQALQQQLELSLQGFQYKNNLLLEQANKKLQIDSEYYGRYQDVLAQINTENSLAEQIRQYNESLAEDKRQFDASLAEEQRQYNESLAASKAKSSGGGSNGGSYIIKDGSVGGGSYNNSGYSTSVVKQAQAYVGASADGKWGANSAAAAKKRGYSSLAAVVAALGGHGINRDTKAGSAIDTKSVIKAGYAGASGKTLAKAVNEGKLRVTDDGKKTTFTPTMWGITDNLLYSKSKIKPKL